MSKKKRKISSSVWIGQIFKAGQVNKGNIVRRDINSVEKYASIDELKSAAKARGFKIVQIGNQLIILCNDGDIKIID